MVRDPVEWIDSFFKRLHHIPPENKKNILNFLTNEFYSIYEEGEKKGEEIMEDRNIFTKERYKNIFELRHTKIKWMLEDLPNKVKNYIFITHEQLLYDFENTLLQIKNKGLIVKENIQFPVNTNIYKKNQNEIYVKKENVISSERILNHPDLILYYEKRLNYIK
jgi:phage pi2 protein 07